MASSEFDNIILPVYCNYIKDENKAMEDLKTVFANKKEFEINTVENREPINLKSLQDCIKSAIEKEEEVIIICNTKHNFGCKYNFEYLINNILKANEYGCEILLGGLNKFNHAVPINTDLFWVDSFSSSNFIVLFNPVFNKILNEKEIENTDIFEILSYLTSHKMAMYPFISENNYNQVESKVKHQNFGEQLQVYKNVYDIYLESAMKY